MDSMFVALGRSLGISVVLAAVMLASLLPGQTTVHLESRRSFSTPAIASELDRDIDERRFPAMQKGLAGCGGVTHQTSLRSLNRS
jgi:hypothetical protein